MRSALARRPSYAPATGFFHHSFPPCAALIAALLFALGTPSSAHARPGVWSDTLAVPGAIAVHMVLMPADTADYTSQILWWEGSDATGFKGGVFLFRPASDQSDSVLQKDFDLREVQSPGLNIFCAGHTHMADGSAFINGGSELEGGENGENHSYIYDPVARGFSATQVDTMSQRRWYPTATLLPDGRLVSFSGSSYTSTHVWGGLGDGETVASDDSLHRMAIVAGGGWDPSIARGGLSESQWPLAREGHSVAYLGLFNAEFYFGGVDANGKYQSTVWELFRDEPVLFSDYDYDWKKTDVSTSPTTPAKRTQHIGVPYDDSVLVVFGGLEDGGSTNELWELRREPDLQGGYNWQWKQPQLNIGPRPSARMGAVAFDDPVLHRVLIFGGAADSALTTLRGDTLWSVHLSVTGDSAWWDTVSVAGSSEIPTPRVNAAMGADASLRDYYDDQGTLQGTQVPSAVMVGGRLAGGTLTDDVWMLWSMSDGTARWQRVTGTNPPPARERAAAVIFATDRLYLIGGRLANGTADASVYSLSLVHPEQGSANRPWETEAPASRPLVGHTAHQWHTAKFARVPELYDPATNDWTRLESAHLLQEWYPFMFLMPDPHLNPSPNPYLFFAGPADSTFTLDLDPSSPSWTYISRTPDYRGGSAVMYRIGKVMKCGRRDTEDFEVVGSSRTVTIDLTAPDPEWADQDTMAKKRVNHNLTLLPNGQVLVTGGTGYISNFLNGDPVYQPELWDPGTQTWTDSDGGDLLASSTQQRGYHSTALLLPDGRVLCGGGFNNPPYEHTFDVYSPPYLFSSGTTPATRPKLLGLPGRLHYGDTITVHSDVRLDKVVLLRPGAVTHAFNEDQRWVSLDTLWTDSTTNPASFTYTTRIPAAKDSLPPGHYMLFGLLGDTPSIARWVHLGDPPNAADIGDRVPPGPPYQLSLLHQLCTTVTLKFGVEGDDSSYAGSGTPRRYHLRYRDGSSICDTCWTTFWGADSVDFDQNSIGFGGQDTVQVPGLTVSHTYYFRLVAEDDREANTGNRSFMSNQTWVHVLGCLGGGLDGGSGGGGGLAARQTGALALEATGTPAENSLLVAAAGAPETADVMRLAQAPLVSDGLAHAWVRHEGSTTTSLDRVRLVALDHDGAGEPFVLPTRDLLGAREPAATVTTPDGTSLAEAIAAAGTDGFPVAAGDTLIVTLAPTTGESVADVTANPLLVTARTDLPGVEGGGIQVEGRGADGAWQPLGTLQARRYASDLALDAVGTTTVRLTFFDDHRLTFVGRIAPTSGTLTRHDLEPAQLIQGTDQALDPAVLQSDGAGLTLSGADTLTLGFTPPALEADLARTWFLEVTAARTTDGATPARDRPDAPLTPTAFALSQNRPNPFTGTTSIACSLPRPSDLRLEVFDIAGRLVRVLADGRFEAGLHAFTWDHRDRRGLPAPAGVYLYRMRADAFHAERKMILFP